MKNSRPKTGVFCHLERNGESLVQSFQCEEALSRADLHRSLGKDLGDFGIFVGKAFDDFKLLDVAEKVSPFFTSKVEFAVCGAHLKGEPLHHELQSADFIEATTTAPEYKMFAFQDGNIPKPALVSGGSSRFYVEVYALSPAEFGRFVAKIPAPLGMGKIQLSSGKIVSSFIGDASILQKADEGFAKDISALGDWRKYRLSL